MRWDGMGFSSVFPMGAGGGWGWGSPLSVRPSVRLFVGEVGKGKRKAGKKENKAKDKEKEELTSQNQQ